MAGRTKPPCYDEVNHKDCPDRDWCKVNGRSKCTKWVEYETKHHQELEEINRKKSIDNASYEPTRIRHERYVKRYGRK